MRMNTAVKIALLVAAALSMYASSVGAAPPPVTYQGQLKFDGAPVNGRGDFIFELYDAEVDGRLIASVELAGVEVVNGLFTVELNFYRADVFDGSPRWLEISVRTSVGSATLTPRQMITPTPYAIYAYTAPGGSGGDCLWTASGSNIYYNAGNVGVGTSTPGTDLDVNGTARMTGFQLTTAPAAGYVLTSNATGTGTWQEATGEESPWNTSGSDVYYTAGDVGIGTSNPVYDLHVVSSGRAVHAQSSGSGTSNPALYAYNSNGSGIAVFSTATSTDANAVFVNKGSGPIIKGFSGATGGDHVFGVNNDGHVGVGKGPSADVPLDVAGGDNWDVAGGSADLRIGNSSYGLRMGVALGGLGVGSSRIFAKGGNHKLTLGSNDQDVLTVVDTNGATAGGGYVGIGTSDPEERLHVVGNAEVDGMGSFAYPTTGNTGVLTGTTTSSGRGVHGSSLSGIGVYGFSNSEVGVYGYSNNGAGVRAKSSGTGTGNPALLVENIDSSGIGVFSTSSSTDANAVFVNKGSGDLIKAFSGATGGDLVFRVENNGKTSVGILKITGGSDLAENFEVGAEAEPGMVVAIDPDHPGKMCVARGAYNRRVAGVISGANDLGVGMVLADLPGAENSLPVALSGRVWVFADATPQPIEPGDLLTTADRAGHAMAVADYDRAHGAVIGKAMTRLAKGETGMVLVLVNLQ